MTDTFIAQAAREDAQRRAQRSTTLVSDVNPDRMARAQRNAEILRLPADVIYRDPSYDREAQTVRSQQFLSEAPKTAAWMGDEQNAAIAHDNVESLSGIEKLTSMLGTYYQRTYIDPTRRLGAGLYESIGKSLEGIAITDERLSRRLGVDGPLPITSLMAEVGRRNQRAAAYLRGEQGSEKALSSWAPDFAPRINYDMGLGGDVAEGLGQVAGQIGIAIGTAGFGSLPSMWGQGVAQMDERVQEAQQREGRTENNITDDAALLAGGIVTTLTEKLGLDAIMGALPAPVRARLTNKLVDIGVAGLTEGSSEVAEGVGQNAAAKIFLGEDTGLLDGNLTYQGGVGAIVGSTARALLMTAIPGRQHITDQERANEAVRSAETFDAAVQAVVQNPLRERSPERFAEFLKAVADPEAEVVVPAEAVANFFQSNPDLDPWLDEWDIRDQVQEAVAAGTDVVFDQATYLAKVAPTAAHEAWAQDLRHGLGAMSAREAEAFAANGQESLAASFDAAIDEAVSVEERIAPEVRVRDEIFSQLRAAGYTIDAANTQATLASRAFARRAERNPNRFADAYAAYQNNGLTIQQEFPNVLRERMDRIDVMIEALRRGRQRPSDRRMFGRSMMEFLAQEGGVLDTGGELAALGVDAWHRPRQGGRAFRRRFIRSAEQGGNAFAPDQAARRAVEAGYLPEGAGPNELFAAVRDEMSGRPTYSRDFEADLQGVDNANALDELERLMADLGVDPSTNTNAEIKAALEAAAGPAFDGGPADASYDQSGRLNTDSEAFRDETFFQSTPFTGPRGQITFSQGRATINLFHARDLSTFFHEFGHLTLENLVDDALAEGASDQVKADLQIVLDWFSREAGETITADNIGVDQHELWARASERYLMEGKAPSLELREVFRTVKAWLMSIYRSVTSLNAPITDDIRAVMDRLLATEDEIEQARVAAGAELGVESFRELGATDAEAAAYEKAVARARSDAEGELLDRVMRAVRRQRTKEWNDRADAIRDEMTARVDAMPDVAAIEFMVSSRTPMSREVVVSMLGDEAGLALLPKRVPPIVSDNGVHPDTVAEAAGYANGQAMLNGLMEYEAEKRQMVRDGDNRSVRKARIDNLIRETLLDQYGDPLNDGSIEQEAIEAIHSERYGEILAMDLNMLARRSGQQPAPIDALRAWARERIGSRPVRDAKPGRYLRAERTASNAAQKALAAGDRVEAFKQKQAQTINNVLYVAARQAETYAEAAISRMKRLAGRVPSIHVDYKEQINALLDQYELRDVSGAVVQRRKSLAQFVREREEAGETVNIPLEVLEATRKTNLADLTVDELRALDETINHLAHLGRLKSQLIVAGEKRDLDRVADQAWAGAQSLPNVAANEAPGDQNTWEQIVSWGAKMEVSLVKAQEYFRLLDGNDPTGTFTTVLDRAGQAAADRRVELQEEFWGPVIEARNAIPAAVEKTWTDTLTDHPFLNPNTGEPIKSLKRRDLLGIAGHVGTVSNFEKMAKGYGLISKEADAMAVSAARLGFIAWLDERLDASEWAYVQARWDAHERLRPQYFAVARQIEGAEPEPVEASDVPTKGGTLKGGYVPISYHPDYDMAAERREQREASAIFGDVMTAGPRADNGSTNARTAYVGPVKISLDDARYAAEKQITYTAYAEYIDNSLKFLRHPLVSQTIKQKLGLSAYRTMEPWLASQVRDELVTDPGANPILRLARGARANMTAAVLMGSATVLLAQPGGLAQSSALLGPKWLAKGISHNMTLAAAGKLRGFITERSEFMRLRIEQGDLDRDFRLAMQQARGAKGLRERALTLTGKAIAVVDFYAVSSSTWLGAFDKAMSEGREEADAVLIADQAVRRTQGGGRAIDQAGIQRANEVTKMLTFAYGWANAYYNMQRQAVVDFKNGQDRFENAVRLSSLLILPALLDAFLSGDWPEPGEDTEETIRNFAGWFARNAFFGALAGVPVVRDVAGNLERAVDGKYVGALGQTPLGRIGDEVMRLSMDAWYLAFDEEKDPSRRWPSHLINSTGLLFGLPGTNQVARVTNYLQDVRAGEQNPDSVTDWMNGLLHGPQEDQK